MTGHRHNLCLFTNRFGHGGTEHQFADIVSRLDQKKYNLLVACFSRVGEFYEMVAAAGLPVFEFPRGRWFAPRTAQCALQLVRLLRRERVDLVHSFDFHTNLFAGPLARLAGVPLYISSRRDTGSMFTARQRWKVRRVFLRSDCIVANSQAALDSLLHEGIPAGLVRIVRNGVDLERFSPNGNRLEARRRWGWGDDTPLIGVIANLRPEKGHDILLKAVPEIVEHFPQAHFLFAGPGPLEADLRANVKANGLSSHVSFLGDFSDILGLLAAIDIVVLPSTSESLPNVILEAMSAGRPVIASDVGGCKELIEPDRNGLLFPSGDAHALAKQIMLLLAKPELRASLGHAARKRAESEFDINRSVRRMESIYDELLERRTAGP